MAEKMHRAIGFAVALLVPSLFGCGADEGFPTGAGPSGEWTESTASPLTLSESFETGWGGFVADHDLQCEPGCGLLDWSLVRSTAQAQAGIYSLAGTINGSHDDGTIWAERSIPVASSQSSVAVKLEFSLWSPTLTPVTWPVVAYAGVANPETELDFTVIGQTNQVAGWKKYSFTKTVAPKGAPSIWVAFGFGVAWEVTRTYYLDSVTITTL